MDGVARALGKYDITVTVNAYAGGENTSTITQVNHVICLLLASTGPSAGSEGLSTGSIRLSPSLNFSLLAQFP